MRSTLRLQELRAYAVARSLFAPTTLARAIDQLGFVQADPIRAPARAQDLTLRHRVAGYRAGDLERRYPELAVEEDHFLNYGYLPRRHLSLMLPRTLRRAWDRKTRALASRVRAFVAERGEAHPREVDDRFQQGRVTNYWGGSSSATTHLLERMHYVGLIRVARRANGVRVYAVREEGDGAVGEADPRAKAEALLALAVAKYAPLTAAGLRRLASRLRYAAPQLTADLRAAGRRALAELPHARVGSTDWYWPAGEVPGSTGADAVRFLAPFDPIVWDRERFELFWGWAYRFEAYTPVRKRKLGYYALPLLWRSDVVGWANISVAGAGLEAQLGFVNARPRGAAFSRALDAEIERMRSFLTAQGMTASKSP